MTDQHESQELFFPKKRVFFNGTELHEDLVVSWAVERGEVEVLLPVARRTMGDGPEYVPLIGVWRARPVSSRRRCAPCCFMA